MSQRRYRKEGGTCCPFCRGDQIEGHEVVIDNGQAHQGISCNDCDKEWTDTYQLHHYTEN